MKDFTKRELLMISLAVLLCGATVFVMFNQIKLNRQLESTFADETSTEVQISWFEESTGRTTAGESVSSSENKQGVTYIANRSSKKIHSPDCQYAQNIKDENKEVIVTDNLQELLDKGYSICSKCGAE